MAAALTLMSLPFLVARAAGGQPPNPGPKLAALAPLGIVPAVAGVAVAAVSSWWLALVLAGPALILVAWQCPPLRPRPRTGRGERPTGAVLRVLTLNVKGGTAEAEAVTASVAALEVDILAVQELTAGLVRRLALSGLDDDPAAQSPRPAGGLARHRAVDALAADPADPGRGRARGHSPGAHRPAWRPARHRHRRAPGRAGSGPGTSLAAGTRADPGGPGRHHRPAAGGRGLQRQPGSRRVPRPAPLRLRGLRRRRPPAGLARSHLACRPPLPAADAAGSRAGPARRVLVHEARTVRVPGTDHLGVLAVLEFS